MRKFVQVTLASSLFMFLSAALAHEHGAKSPQYTPKFSQLGEGRSVEYNGRPIYHHVSNDDLPSNVALFEEVLPAKSLGAPPHTHENEDEIFVVLDGTVHFLNGKQEVVAKSGTVASLPRMNQHGFWNPYDEPAHLLVFVAPGHFSTFFEAVQNAVKDANGATPEEVGGIIAQEAEKLGVKIDMSQLPASALSLLQPNP
jgi:quercetin dioxygenase-like cupin family protein